MSTGSTSHLDPEKSRGHVPVRLEEPDAPREGRILLDAYGQSRYLGESSGATFLNHIREYMATVFPIAFNTAWPITQATDTKFISALGHYQTHDSRPLLVSSPDHLMPSIEQAKRMLSELSHWTRNGSHTAISGGIFYWANTESLLAEYELHLADPRSSELSRNLALINAAFAVACQFNPDCAPEWDAGDGQTFFARARALVGNPLDIASLSDAPVLTLLGFYLVNSYRRDAAYMYISVALHILIVHGVHRAWSIDEDGKRKFWDVYNLDRWLSCTMGRPVMVVEESIQLDVPRPAPGLPQPDGLRAHVELSKITHYIAANVYGVSKHIAEPHSTALCIHRALSMLKSWEYDLPDSLRYVERSNDQDHAAYDLQMAANHLKILAVRAWLFDSVKRATANLCLRGRRDDTESAHHNEIDLAVAAARQTIVILRHLVEIRKPNNLVHTSIHHIFNAALTLELYQILCVSDHTPDRESIHYIISLLEIQNGSNKPFAKDCAGVLSDLASMMVKLRSSGGQLQHLARYKAAHEEESLPVGGASHWHGPSTWAHNSVELLPSRLPGTSETSPTAMINSEDRQNAYDEIVSWL
ncbi:uncharacterized protein HMPREF1541_08445 [Cyphellophora europaea CBS 101466]|uniref:Xylanolytic transcriptional activator regulatory domain-containing protein n=1 Tax=Cyphellophora europaea (strain CBS 101466) TaxID=1220924 RepID=W2RP08_CYPE1|nr:uncharacterized protein HMPREF1541_08445 [Cyphellophora europaea CBS 101466]ETN37454.1 hypothetical protein HMPREF1541_08445 [Cyphellophora europaea CBS 101466]